MPSTYTGSGIELIADGEQSGTWGQTTNTNLQIINRMTSEAGAIALSGTTHTLTISDGTLSDGQYGVLVFGGSPSGTNTVTISPNDAKRIFIVRNTTAQSVVMTQGSGGNVTILTGDSAVVYCDGAGAGAAVVDVSDTFITSNNLKVASNLSDLASASTARTNLGVAIGTNVQAWDANLDQIAALAVTDGNIIVGNGSAWVAESGATARTSLGLGTAATRCRHWRKQYRPAQWLRPAPRCRWLAADRHCRNPHWCYSAVVWLHRFNSFWLCDLRWHQQHT
jgi:hypothetical protein